MPRKYAILSPLLMLSLKHEYEPLKIQGPKCIHFWMSVCLLFVFCVSIYYLEGAKQRSLCSIRRERPCLLMTLISLRNCSAAVWHAMIC